MFISHTYTMPLALAAIRMSSGAAFRGDSIIPFDLIWPRGYRNGLVSPRGTLAFGV